jgi:rRNA maturation RNase YbeY
MRSELSIALVDDDEMAALNREHRGRPGPTDVLSFSLLEGDHEPYRGRLLGDVVISVGTARRQARRAHRSFDAELLRLLVHGTLHLLGHDHKRDADARRMQSEERRVRREVIA